MKSFVGSRWGFSLVELMIVVAIIGVLATIGVPTFRTMVQKSKKSEAKTALGGLYTSEVAFFSEYGVYGNAVDKLGFEMDGNPATRPYNVGFFNGNCQGFTPTIAPAVTSTNGTALNKSFPGYFTGALFGLNGKAFPATNAAGDAGCALANVPADGSTFTAGAAGLISNSGGNTTPDVWTINQGRQLSNIVDGSK